MNKAQLIEALSDRLRDKKVAGAAVNDLVDVIVRTVNKGEKVKVKKINVPASRAGTTSRTW